MIWAYGRNVEMFFMQKYKEVGQVRLIGRNRIDSEPFLCHQVVEKEVEAGGDVFIKGDQSIALDKGRYGGGRAHFLYSYK